MDSVPLSTTKIIKQQWDFLLNRSEEEELKGGPCPSVHPRCVVSHEGIALIMSFKTNINYLRLQHFAFLGIIDCLWQQTVHETEINIYAIVRLFYFSNFTCTVKQHYFELSG